MIILERREGAWAILETDDGQIRVDAASVPANASDGAVLVKTGDAYQYDRETTRKRLEKIRQRMHRTMKKPSDG